MRTTALMAVAALLLATPAHAGDGPIGVSIQGATALKPAMHGAIASELDGSVQGANATGVEARLSIVVGEDRVYVRYEPAGEPPIERSIPRPTSDAELVDAVAWLAGNLARDQTSALLAELRRDTPRPLSPPLFAPTLRAAPTLQGSLSLPPGTPLALSSASVAAPTADERPATSPAAELAPSAIQVSLAGPVAIYPDGSERRFALDVALLFGHSGALAGVGIYSGAAYVERSVEGLAVAGAWLHHAGALEGFGVAGAVQSGSGNVTGLQLAGVANIEVGADDALVRGIQLAGVVNTAQDIQGLQLGGVVNVARDVEGVQFAGQANVARVVDGVQWSGAANVARDVNGVQLGVVNVAGRVRGAQIGLVNIAEENEGTAIGLVNVAGNGRVQAVSWASSTSLVNLGAKFRVGPIVVQPSMGYHPLNVDAGPSGQLAMGVHVPFDDFFAEFNAAYAYEDQRLSRHIARSWLTGGWQFAERIGAFIGAGVAVAVEDEFPEREPDLAPELLAGLLLF